MRGVTHPLAYARIKHAFQPALPMRGVTILEKIIRI